MNMLFWYVTRKTYLAWAAVATSVAGAAGNAAASVPNLSADAIDAGNLQSFFDDKVPRLMEKAHVAGMAVAAVYDGEVAFKRGYGVAKLETDEKVDPDETLFRVGSVSKLFTWTAILQLVERGRVDLEEDINTYLKMGDFHIPDDDFPGQPITSQPGLSHQVSMHNSRNG